MYKRAKLNEIFNDYIVFRELNPIKKDLPGFKEIQKELNLNVLPRKNTFEFALVLSYILDKISRFKRVYYLGDTEGNDGNIIKNLASLNKYDVLGIITDNTLKIDNCGKNPPIILNTKWENLQGIVEKEFNFSEDSVLIIDIDKTLIGARGRNEKAIDKARTDAIFEMLKGINPQYRKSNFLNIYNKINTKNFMTFTGDNQDIVAITSIVIYLGEISFDEFEKGLKERKIINPTNFLMGLLKKGLKNKNLEATVSGIVNLLLKNNPTPFVEFRKKEFKATIDRMDFLSDHEDIDNLLNEEILITKEVFEVGKLAQLNSAYIFGLSDKPELATLPSKEVDLPPIFEKTMKIY
jgi:hypothetical protein